MSAQPKAGMGVDAAGGPVIDPTENVKALNEAANKRQDDLRAAAKELADVQSAHLRELSDLRALHQRELDKAESDRLNSIRQVDREEVAKSAVTANTAITTLAKQTTDLQTTLQKQTADIAVAVEQRQSAFASDTNKRLSAVELALSEGKGKQQMSDPAMERLAAVVEKVALQQQLGTGKSDGIDSTWKVLIAGGGLLLAFLAYENRSQGAQQPIQVIMPSAAPGITTTTTQPPPSPIVPR